MKRARVFAVAAAIVAVGATVAASAQQQADQQTQQAGPGWGYMGPWMMGGYGPGYGMMGPGGMMGWSGQGYGNMGPWMMGRNGPGYGMMGRNGRDASMCTMMTAHIDGRLAYLKTELKITDTQESLWDAYANAARDNAQSMTARCTAMMSQTGANAPDLPDRLDQHEQFMAAQLDSLRALNKSLKPLYGALNDAQKQVANQLIWSPMGMM